jgi:hypothetical protein
MRSRLSPDGGKVTSSEILERGAELVKDPTTGAILEGKLYFMANTGIDNLEENGKIADPAKGKTRGSPCVSTSVDKSRRRVQSACFRHKSCRFRYNG